jgi:hypothetical protein
MGPLVLPLLSIGAKLLSKQQEDERFRANLPRQILARSAAAHGAPMEELNTRMALDNHESGAGQALGLAPEIAQLVAAMGSKDDPTDPRNANSQFQDPSKLQESEYENGRLLPDDQLRKNSWARNWRPFGT